MVSGGQLQVEKSHCRYFVKIYGSTSTKVFYRYFMEIYGNASMNVLVVSCCQLGGHHSQA